MASSRPLLKVGTGSKRGSSSSLGPAAPAGRPTSNIGKYLLRPTPESKTGYELLNQEPQVLKEVHEKYLKSGELPPALQPKYLRRPAVLDAGRTKNISRGWRKPRSRQG